MAPLFNTSSVGRFSVDAASPHGKTLSPSTPEAAPAGTLPAWLADSATEPLEFEVELMKGSKIAPWVLKGPQRNRNPPAKQNWRTKSLCGDPDLTPTVAPRRTWISPGPEKPRPP